MPLPSFTDPDVENSDSRETKSLVQDNYSICETQAQHHIEVSSRVSSFSIIDSTLREGEQFSTAFFDTYQKVQIAKSLDDLGVEYLELSSPAASSQSLQDCKIIGELGLKAKIVTHIRCHMDDARLAIETGVQGVNIVMGTSSILRDFSHGKDINGIIGSAVDVIGFVKSHGLEVRFSSEDSFRTDISDLLAVYTAVDKVGVDRVGIADTIGCANPRQVYEVVSAVRRAVSCDIECHFHNDIGFAIANAYTALEAGATHIDTCVLGIGERNGITSLGGLIASTYVANKEYIKGKYRLNQLLEVEKLVAQAVKISIPFNNVITGSSAFSHKAGIHTKAVIAKPETYEVLDPVDFGRMREIIFGSRLTGWNAIKFRAKELGLGFTEGQVKAATAQIKRQSDMRQLSLEDVDQLLYHISSNYIC